MKSIILSAILTLSAISALAQLQPATPPPAKVSVSWDASPSGNIVSYNVYYGTAPRFYTNVISCGPATTFTISNLTRGTTIYLAATAIDANGLESDFSNEISYLVPSRPLPPQLRLSMSASGKLIVGTGESYATYSVERTQDFAAWLAIGTAQADGSGRFVFTDPAPPATAFYRTRPT